MYRRYRGGLARIEPNTAGHKSRYVPSMTIRACSFSRSLTVSCLALVTFGCGRDEKLPDEAESDASFISHVPGDGDGDGDQQEDLDGGDSGDTGIAESGSGGSSSVNPDNGGEEAPERLIAADLRCPSCHHRRKCWVRYRSQ